MNASLSGQYLTFTLDGGAFALDIATVREVLEMPAITRVPRAPRYMRGVINLRGNGVPVVDMRRKFGLPDAERTVNTCIIIAEVIHEGASGLLGALVDAVREVVEIPASALLPPPRMGSAVSTEYLHAMGKLDSDFVLILDPERVFSLQELMVPSSGSEMDDAAA